MPPKRIRTREGSCWPCKDRRVLCDLKKPACAKCTVAGHACEYGTVRLRWDNGVASRGRLAGQRVPIAGSQAIALANSPPAQWHILYFEKELFPLFSLTTSSLEVDINAFAVDPALCEAVKAVASSHRLYRGGARSSEALIITRKARWSAIKAFREKLGDPQFDLLASKLFSANVLLCVLDGMIDPGAEDAATFCHYQGGRAILQYWDPRNDPVASKSGTLTRLISIFATMDATYSVLSGNEPFFDREWWRFFIGKEAWWTGIKDDRPFIEVMGVCAELARLKHQALQDKRNIDISELLALQLDLERTCQSRESSPADGDVFGAAQSEAFVACYRMAAYVYMYRALCNLDCRHDLVQESVSRCLEAISGDMMPTQFSHCQIFPALIIGAHCMKEPQRDCIRKMIVDTGELLSFGSVTIMENFLKESWRLGTARFEWTDLFRPVSHVAFLF